jgi:uncharacterized protein YbgA (DUF1722 family)
MVYGYQNKIIKKFRKIENPVILVVIVLFSTGVFNRSSKFVTMNPISGKIKENLIIKHGTLSEKDIAQYVKERFEDLKNDPKMSDLVNFHTNNKYLLMAHNQEKLKDLGNIVANHHNNKIKEVLENYESCLEEALYSQPTIKTHTNVLMHIFGYFGKCFNQNEKNRLLELIKKFRKNQASLGKVLSEIEPITYQFNNMYLLSQTYFLLYSVPNISKEIKSYEKSLSLKNS